MNLDQEVIYEAKLSYTTVDPDSRQFSSYWCQQSTQPCLTINFNY